MAPQELNLTEAAQGMLPVTPDPRPPATAICILLPIWGDEYIDLFLERSLPTLLAPGNIPALAKALPTRFVFLTRARDEAYIRTQPAFEHLRRLTSVEFLPVDDLILSANHSTTITLAYARAVRQAGAAMLDTCFFFLVSDYIMADGSLASVLTRMQAGASAVQVGNFQLDEHIAEPWLDARLAGAESVLALTASEIMQWALECLHPLTAANIVNFPLCHNTHANRFLWSVDRDTLIGRFYLLHMICIRPEIVDFIIGSSCDYSFVPEMAPSGNVVTITDSDDYLVVELQPLGHEYDFLRLGPSSVEALAESLSEWTTAGHRANAEQTILFHTKALPPSLPAALAGAEAFIRDLTSRLETPPQPHRNHPYWLGAITAFDRAIAAHDSGVAESSLPVMVRIVRRLQTRLLGRVPEVTRAHPRWPDFQGPLAACREILKEKPRLLVGSGHSTPLTEWLRGPAPDRTVFSLRRMLLGWGIRGARPGAFDAAIIELADDHILHMDEIVRRIKPLLRPGGQIILFAINTDWSPRAADAERLFTAGLASLARSKPWPHEVNIVSASRFRWRVNGACARAAGELFQRPKLSVPFRLLATAALVPLAVATNLAALRRSNRFRRGRVATSVTVRLRVEAEADQPAGSQDFRRQASRMATV